MPRPRCKPWPPDPNQTASGKPEAVHPVACPDWIYNNRNLVERLWARLKEWQAIATHYEKTASSFMGVLALAAALDWLKS